MNPLLRLSQFKRPPGWRLCQITLFPKILAPLRLSFLFSNLSWKASPLWSGCGLPSCLKESQSSSLHACHIWLYQMVLSTVLAHSIRLLNHANLTVHIYEAFPFLIPKGRIILGFNLECGPWNRIDLDSCFLILLLASNDWGKLFNLSRSWFIWKMGVIILLHLLDALRTEWKDYGVQSLAQSIAYPM